MFCISIWLISCCFNVCLICINPRDSKVFWKFLNDPGTTLPLVLFFRFDRERKIFFPTNITTFVNKQIKIKIYKMGFFDYINPKAAPSLCRGPVLQLFDSQGPKLFLGFFCNSLHILRPLGPLIPWLLMVQNNFWTHLGLGPSLTEAQQPFFGKP